MSFFSLGVLWAGYQLGWYGFCLLKGPGIGFLDLMKPSQVSKVNNWLMQPHSASTTADVTAPGPVVGNGGNNGFSGGAMAPTSRPKGDYGALNGNK